jgi:hypothetical protein
MGMSPLTPFTSPGRTAGTILAGGAATAASASPARPALADTVGPAIRGRLAPTQFPRVSKGWRGGALARGTHQRWCAARWSARGRAPAAIPACSERASSRSHRPPDVHRAPGPLRYAQLHVSSCTKIGKRKKQEVRRGAVRGGQHGRYRPGGPSGSCATRTHASNRKLSTAFACPRCYPRALPTLPAAGPLHHSPASGGP